MILLDLIKGIANYNNSIDEEKRQRELKDLEDRMDTLDLDDNERELVLSRLYEPEDFETDLDDLEETDYYYDE